MNRLKSRWQNEQGALSFEFLGILPFYFMFFLLLWQVVASGYAVFSVKSAVNDAAKTYAATNSWSEAEQTARESLGNSSVVQYVSLSGSSAAADGKFTMNLKAKHSLVFLPSEWKKQTALSLSDSATGRVLLP